jgi:phenylpropionate dioxygenase-like ring-hydroxylating dioxygenase large terminal subunit
MTAQDALVDNERRAVSLLAFTDPEVHREEQERIFARCWLVVAHES